MKFYRNLIILSVVLIVLIAAYILLPKKDENGMQESKSNITVKSLNPEDITDITLKSSSGTVILKKTGQDWKMTSPADYKLDKTLLTGFLKNVSGFKATQIVNDKPSDLDIYGLKTPAAVLIAKTAAGMSVQFELGSLLPIGSGYYFKTADSQTVYSIDDFSAGDMLRTSAEFRDKTIFQFDAKAVAYVSVSKEGKELYRLNKTKTGWDVMSQTKKTGDSTKIKNLTDKLSTLKAKEFINPDSYNRKEIFPEKDTHVIAIGFEKSPELKLIVGKDKDDSSTYVQLEGSQEAVAVYKTDVDFVRGKTEDLMKK